MQNVIYKIIHCKSVAKLDNIIKIYTYMEDFYGERT